jgi:hypothetical protein
VEQSEGKRLAAQVDAQSLVVVGLRAGDAGDLADVLLAAELAANTGSRLVVVVMRDRWARFAQWAAGMYCTFGMEGVAQVSRCAERVVQDDLEHRLAAVVGLVPVDWKLEWVTGSCGKAAVRYARRHPSALVMFRPSAAR